MSAPVIVCRSGVEPLEETEAVLTLGRRTAATLGSELRWLVLGQPPDGYTEIAQRHAVAAVDIVDDDRLSAGGADAAVEAVARYWKSRPGQVLLFAQTFDSRVVAARVAGRIGVGVVTNGTGVEVTGDGGLQISAAAYGGDLGVAYETAAGHACVVALQANAVEPAPAEDTRPEPVVDKVQIELSSGKDRVRVVEAATSEGPRLEDADVIVAGGRGLKSAENYRLVVELAEVLGGVPGASRPIVDEGWIDSAHQVGLTGKITQPALYLAAGISGATQHVVGCTAAKTIVALNIDPDAAIFRHARYGIVGDALEILPELIRAAREAGFST